MRRAISLPAACLAAGLVLAGCGGTDGSGDATGGHDAGGGHGAHGGPVVAGGPADASDADRTIEVEARDIAFDPTSIEVAAGETVTFVVTNAGETLHEFTLGDASAQEEHAEEMEGGHAGEARHGPNSVTVEPGETAELTWRFEAAGELEYACHVPGHYEAGMRGTITVA
ncbi:MAG: cupredoxin family protein [Actinobacteria bacterium]|nr:cupredoxin family protein [Actinomycetota bacterium]